MPKRRSEAMTRWNEEQAQTVLAELLRSGKPVSVFAQERGLDVQRLYWWRRRLGEAERIRFREVVLPEAGRVLATIPPSSSYFEVVLGGGVVVRVPPSFHEECFAKLVAVLARAGVC